MEMLKLFFQDSPKFKTAVKTQMYFLLLLCEEIAAKSPPPFPERKVAWQWHGEEVI